MCEWHYNSHYEWDSDTITIDQLVIVSLDLSKERYTQFSLPRGFDEVSLVEPHVTVLMDCLCFSYDYKRTHFVVWQMKEFGVEQSWTRLVNVTYHDLQINLESFRMLLLCLSENGNVLLLSESNKQPQAILYNHKDNRVEHAEISNNINWTVAQDYVQSLVSP
ncbi:putative F-box associated domain, type 1 [Lupinus albus]|uniref:Putative F-box associated domain, type 1 n=1 Tax=Lupinus albus TaxID=3870 RepID=A0A6A4QMX6_LUPAL|nr:putative F-box associated domain, type 1 [Lupinus albus]